MQLSLNLPALERLLGGDSELEIHLRHQVADSFAGQRLRPLLKDELLKKHADEIISRVDKAKDGIKSYVDARMADEIGKFVKNARTGVEEFALSPKMIAAITAEIHRLSDDIIQRTVAEEMTKRTELLLKTAKWQIDDMVTKGYQHHVDEQIAARFKLAQDMIATPMPWCHECKSYHTKPTSEEHHAALNCKAVFDPNPLPGFVTGVAVVDDTPAGPPVEIPF